MVCWRGATKTRVHTSDFVGRTAVALVQEWVRDVGAPAGLHAGNCRVVTGVIGARESAIEIEVSMHGLSDLEVRLGDVTRHHKAAYMCGHQYPR